MDWWASSSWIFGTILDAERVSNPQGVGCWPSSAAEQRSPREVGCWPTPAAGEKTPLGGVVGVGSEWWAI